MKSNKIALIGDELIKEGVYLLDNESFSELLTDEPCCNNCESKLYCSDEEKEKNEFYCDVWKRIHGTPIIF